jgi:hypothetical protein
MTLLEARDLSIGYGLTRIAGGLNLAAPLLNCRNDAFDASGSSKELLAAR